MEKLKGEREKLKTLATKKMDPVKEIGKVLILIGGRGGKFTKRGGPLGENRGREKLDGALLRLIRGGKRGIRESKQGKKLVLIPRGEKKKKWQLESLGVGGGEKDHSTHQMNVIGGGGTLGEWLTESYQGERGCS